MPGAVLGEFAPLGATGVLLSAQIAADGRLDYEHGASTHLPELRQRAFRSDGILSGMHACEFERFAVTPAVHQKNRSTNRWG
jgi:hypothetical protein